MISTDSGRTVYGGVREEEKPVMKNNQYVNIHKINLKQPLEYGSN